MKSCPPAPSPRWHVRHRAVLPLFLGVVFLAAGCQHGADGGSLARAEPESASSTTMTKKTAATARHHMVVAANPLAAEAGREVLRAGGSAVDAAIAAQMVLGLVEPQSSGLGGGGFLLHYDAGTRSVTSYDGRETAPATATADMFLGPDGEPRPFREAMMGGLAVGVPGLLAMLEAAHAKHGRLPWATLFAPAIRLAENGFAVSPRLHRLVSRARGLDRFAPTAAYFLDGNGAARPAGARLGNPSLAATLRAIAEEGAKAFYKGSIAAELVATVQGASVNPGRMTLSDLASYRTKERAPVCRAYRTWKVCGMGPPSSGGVAVLQILGLLEGFDPGALAPDSAKAAHLFAEAGRLAFADRNAFLADSDFVAVPVETLLDAGYLTDRARAISPGRTMEKPAPGLPEVGGLSTTHLSVVDAEGNAVSMTTSIEQAFGSRLMVRGFLLNNQLTDFSFVATRDGKRVANRVEGGKRPRSSMAPTLVLDEEGRLVAVLGSPGGSRIIGYVARAVVALLDGNLDPQAAAALPHVQNRGRATEVETGTAAEALTPALEALGHEVKARSMTSGLHIIRRTPAGVLQGGADPRREGAALGD